MSLAFILLFTSLFAPLTVHAREDVDEEIVAHTTATAFEDLGIAVRTDKPEGAVLAVALPDVYILPDSKLYWLVQLWESIRIIFAEDPQERADLLLEFSKKRLSETYDLLKKENVSVAVTTVERYKQQLQEALGAVQELPSGAMQQEGYDAFEEQVWYQKALTNIIQVEGFSSIFADISGTLGAVTDKHESLQLTDLE